MGQQGCREGANSHGVKEGRSHRIWQPMDACVGRKDGDAGGVTNDRISDGPSGF